MSVVNTHAYENEDEPRAAYEKTQVVKCIS